MNKGSHLSTAMMWEERNVQSKQKPGQVSKAIITYPTS